MENFNHINDKAHSTLVHTLSHLYTQMPLLKIHCSSCPRETKRTIPSMLNEIYGGGKREFTITCKKFNRTFLNWRQILAWSCASSLQVPSHKCLTEHLRSRRHVE